jgi:hypothetical protein
MNKIYSILFTLILSCCTTFNNERRIVRYIKLEKFDSLVTMWVNKPFSTANKSEIIQVIRIGNALEVHLLWNGGDSINRHNAVLYAKFMDKYYNEFHKIAYYHKDFISINDSIQSFCNRQTKYPEPMKYPELYELASRAKLLQQKRYNKTVLLYLPKKMPLFAGVCKSNDIYRICPQDDYLCDD